MSAGVREVMDVALAPLGDDFAKARGAMEYAISARIILVDMNASLVIGARVTTSAIKGLSETTQRERRSCL